MSGVPVTFGTRQHTARRPARRLAGLLAAQALAAATVAVYLVTGGGLKPDHGLEQLGLLSLNERVEGLDGTGRAAIVVAPGTGRECAAKVAEAGRRRGKASGVPLRYDLIVLTLAPPGFSSQQENLDDDITEIFEAGGITRSLALGRATTGCHPGYVVMAPDGAVRYRTYDDDWQRHGGEQMTLLQAVER